MREREARGWLRFLAEGGVIVSSILLALALDAWWDGVQEDRRRTELVEALTVDFEATRARLAASISRGDSLISRTATFLRLTSSAEPPPVDSLKSLALGTFEPFEFQPAISSYMGARTSGDLQLLQSRELIEAFAEFDQAMAYFEDRSRVFLEWYYLGKVAELREELGSLEVLATRAGGDVPAWVVGAPTAFSLTDSAYLQLARSRRVHGALETGLYVRGNLARGLRQADTAALRVVEELRRLEVN